MKKTLLIGIATFAPLCVVTLASAQGYTPIAGVPGIDVNALSTEGYVTALYKLSITVACLLALYKIIFGGVKWALSDVVTDKGEAKKDIKGALLGLLIVLSAVLILNTINPNLTQLNIFGEGAPSIDAIERAQNELNVSFGDAINSALATPAEVARFGERCLGGGGVISRSEIVMNRAGGTSTLSKCLTNPANINANIGDTFDASKYPPGTGESRFKETCEGNGGRVGDNLFGIDDECVSRNPSDGPGDDGVIPPII